MAEVIEEGKEHDLDEKIKQRREAAEKIKAR